MTAFRVYNPFPVYLDSQGNLAVSGYLKFYESGTTTPKDVYGDQGLTVNNGSQITIGTDGRTVNGLGMPIDIWGDGSYRVRLYASDNTLVAERDDVELPGGSGTAIPALQAGKFLTNDGAVLQWADVLQVPDPTGQANKILSTDGSALFWIAQPTIPTLPEGGLSQTGNVIQIGTKIVQLGGGTAPASGTHNTQVSVTFTKTMSSCDHVDVTPTVTPITSKGFAPIPTVTARSGTGFTVSFDINESTADSGTVINIPVTFTYAAWGSA
jgi:hypothetical protein